MKYLHQASKMRRFYLHQASRFLRKICRKYREHKSLFQNSVLALYSVIL